MKCWGAILAVIFVISTSSVVIADTEDGNEVGVEWTNTYGFYYGDPDEGTIYLPNLQYNDDLVVGFYNILGQDGFSRRYNQGEGSAWEKHFKKAGLGGTDSSWTDDVDFVVYSGHGSPTGFYFNNDHDDKKLRGTGGVHEAEWGDRDLEWILIDACSILQQYDEKGDWDERWGWGVFKGLHLLLGWATETNDSPDRGRVFAELMVENELRIGEAWFTACQLTATRGMVAAFICCARENYNSWYDHLWGHGYVTPDIPQPLALGYYTYTVGRV